MLHRRTNIRALIQSLVMLNICYNDTFFLSLSLIPFQLALSFSDLCYRMSVAGQRILSKPVIVLMA